MKNFSRILFFLFLFYINYISIRESLAQRPPASDSLFLLLQSAGEDTNKINILNDLCRQFNRDGNYEQALEYGIKAKTLSEKTRYIKGIATGYNNIGNIFENQGRYEEALKNHLNAMEIWKKINNKRGLWASYLGIGNLKMLQGDYEKALENYLNSLKLSEEIGDKQMISKSLNGVGLLYENLQNYEKALEYHLKSIKIKEETGDKIGIAKSYNNIGNVYKETEDYQLALDFYFKSVKIKEETGMKQGLANSYYNIGNIFIKQGNYEKALINQLTAFSISKNIGDKQIEANSSNGIGLIYLSIGQLDESLHYTLQSLATGKAIGYKEGIKDSYSILSDLYAKKNDYKQALVYYKLFSGFIDTLRNEQSYKHIAEMQAKYETEKKEKENKLLKQDNEIKELEIEKERSFRNFLITGLIALVLTGGVLSYFFLLIRKKNMLLNTQQKELIVTNNKLVESENNLLDALATKNKFFSIISHDLRGPFISISSYNDFLKENIHSIPKEELIQLTNEFNNVVVRINNLLENLLLWAKTQTGRIQVKKEILSLKNALSGNLQLFTTIAADKKIEVQCCMNENVMIHFDKYMLDAVIRNLLSNAIKYTSENGKVSVHAIENGNEIIIEVRDTGTGINSSDLKKIFNMNRGYVKEGTSGDKGSGLGLILCKEFVELNNGSIWVESEFGKGTAFKFSVPVA